LYTHSRPGLRLSLSAFSVRICRQSGLQGGLCLVYALQIIAASGFPLDVLGRLLVEETSDADIVEVDGTTNEEGVLNSWGRDFVGLRKESVC